LGNQRSRKPRIATGFGFTETQIYKQRTAYSEKNLEVGAYIGASISHRDWQQYGEQSGSKDVYANSEKVVKQVSWKTTGNRRKEDVTE